MKYLLTLTVVVIYLYACKNTTSESSERKDGFTPILRTKEDSLYHEVMQGHDIGMAKMSRLRKHIRHVQQALDSIRKVPSKKMDKEHQQALLDLQEDLNYADLSMFTWMEEFKVDSAKTDTKKRLTYLESEKVKVEKVRDNILNSLQRADSLLKN